MTLDEAYRCLDLTPDAPPLQVERAFRRKQALYAGDTLATYALLDADARQVVLERLEGAYRLITADRSRDCAPLVSPAVQDPPEASDPAVAPGRFLKERREGAGLTLREIAGRTKISPMKLAQIEEERYAQLPAPVYLRGFILAYARALGLPDPDRMARFFLERHREEVAET